MHSNNDYLDYLAHKDHKYISKVFKNGRWNYKYGSTSTRENTRKRLNKEIDDTTKETAILESQAEEYEFIAKESKRAADSYGRSGQNVRKAVASTQSSYYTRKAEKTRNQIERNYKYLSKLESTKYKAISGQTITEKGIKALKKLYK